MNSRVDLCSNLDMSRIDPHLAHVMGQTPACSENYYSHTVFQLDGVRTDVAIKYSSRRGPVEK